MVNCRILRLVPAGCSEETIRALEALLDQARAGEVIGLAYIALHQRDFSVDAVGRANDRPILTRGMVCVLDDLVRERMFNPRSPPVA